MNAAAAIALGLCLIALLVLARRVELAGGGAWWRVLVPSWRFFESPDVEFVLEVRVRRGNAEPSAFRPAIPPWRRGPLSLLFSPQHNLRLACHDLVERWVAELGEQGEIGAEELEALASYARVKHAVAYFLRDEGDTALLYQLQLSSVSEAGELEPLFLSPYYPWRERDADAG